MCWGPLAPVPRELRRLYRHEVLHEEIALRVLGKAAHTVVDTELDGAHQLVSLDFLIRNLRNKGNVSENPRPVNEQQRVNQYRNGYNAVMDRAS